MTVIRDGVSVTFEVVHVRGPEWLLRGPGGTQGRAHVARDKHGAWVHVLGRTHVLKENARASSQDAAGSLEAPMTGRIVEVRVAVGDTVAAGAVLLVLSAMKMQMEIRAPRAGLVREIRFAAGQQAEGGAVLAVVEPAK